MSSDYEFQYMMLSRLQSDCKYFLGFGGRSLNNLCYNTVEEHITEMKRLWNIFPDDGKPEWLSMEGIEELEKEMNKEEGESIPSLKKIVELYPSQGENGWLNGEAIEKLEKEK